MMSEVFRFAHISTGDILRAAVKHKTELGNKAKRFMESGMLVPDEVVDAIVAERLKQEDCGHGFILDGYPRTIPQAETLQSLFGKDGIQILTLGIHVEDAVLLERLASRWTCPRCSKTFSETLAPGTMHGHCDACNVPLVQRKDDAAEVIAERLQVYRDMTKPLIHYYQDRDAYVEVDGERSVREIFDAIIGIVKDRAKLQLAVS